MPGSELCDEIERRFWSVLEVAWHAFKVYSSSDNHHQFRVMRKLGVVGRDAFWGRLL
jgi:hypothetical protein